MRLMRRKLSAIIVLILALTLFTALFFLSSDPIELNSPKAKEIRSTIENAFDLISLSHLNLDCSQYREVFIDTGDYKIIDKKQYVFIEQELGAGFAKDAGYLTAMRAKCEWYTRIMPIYKTYLAKAKSENRELTLEEWQELEELSLGYGIPAPIEDEYYSPDYKVNSSVEMQSIYMNWRGSRAIVRFDDHAAVQEAILIKVDGRWFISSIIPINIHY